MPTTEADRHHLLVALEAVIGKEAAMTLAEHLPPSGWADVATTRDLDLLEARLEATLHRELATTQRTLFLGVLGAFAANAGLVWAAVQSVGG